MARGGRREGAGRRKGSNGEKVLARLSAVSEAMKAVEDALPDAFRGDAHALLISVYKDPSHPLPLRLDAAKAAISFEKPKLAAVEHSGDAENPLAIAVMTGVPDDTDSDDQRPATQSH